MPLCHRYLNQEELSNINFSVEEHQLSRSELVDSKTQYFNMTTKHKKEMDSILCHMTLKILRDALEELFNVIKTRVPMRS